MGLGFLWVSTGFLWAFITEAFLDSNLDKSLFGGRNFPISEGSLSLEMPTTSPNLLKTSHPTVMSGPEKLGFAIKHLMKKNQPSSLGS